MLMSYTSYMRRLRRMILLIVVVLLNMVRLMRLVLILVLHVHLHESLMTISPIHHSVLSLLMPLVEYVEGSVGGSLRDWRPRRRWSFIVIPCSSTIDRRTISS